MQPAQAVPETIPRSGIVGGVSSLFPPLMFSIPLPPFESTVILASRFVGGDGVALRLEPLRDRPLGDGDAHLWHHDLGLRSCGHDLLLSVRGKVAESRDDIRYLWDEGLLEWG